MKKLFDELSHECSKHTTKKYSTSFSLATRILDQSIRGPIYNIYGFVRLADEIVDSFHEYNQESLLNRFEAETWMAIKEGISLNPILNSFQGVVRKYNIQKDLIEAFFSSMRSDLSVNEHEQESYETYIYGSAEVVGLMCLRVFTYKKPEMYDDLVEPARRLGAAFQKINFLRDLAQDYNELNRQYFPKVNFSQFSQVEKLMIEREIEADFKASLSGIKALPKEAKLGVYIAFRYYYSLFNKIKQTPAQQVIHSRIRIADLQKYSILLQSFLKHKLVYIS